eukprot:TRINITY_DN36181_c0_g1_i2.p2 TRINITY_DN36181_c0_g1~~TRINITY_DN36181_c0_g1_i2.p2  ORF type:complete len:381 (+),score=139.96 TRINITY_DN36181_c0_g1_i2:93-1145(+)
MSVIGQAWSAAWWAASVWLWSVLHPVSALRLAVLSLLAWGSQTYMLCQGTVLFLLLLWRNRRPQQGRGRRPSVSAGRAAELDSCLLSCIIMVRNEEQAIAATLRNLARSAARASQIEVVLVDSGCTDNTIPVARRTAEGLPFRVRFAKPDGDGRGVALDAGVAESRGGIIFALHADCTVPPQWDDSVRIGLSQPGALATVFKFGVNRDELTEPLPGVGWMEYTVGIRTRCLQLPFGDQGIALTRERLAAYGGYGGTAYPLMEDFQLVGKMRRDYAQGLGHIQVIPAVLRCSPRRWMKLQIWRVCLINQIVMLWYQFGATPQQLFDFYYGKQSAHVPWWIHILSAPLMPKR